MKIYLQIILTFFLILSACPETNIYKIYPEYQSQNNLIIKYFFTDETSTEPNPDFKEYSEELTTNEIADIKSSPIPKGDGILPPAYKKVFYQNDLILWEELYSWKGILLRFYTYAPSLSKKRIKNKFHTIEKWLNPKEIEFLLNQNGYFKKNKKSGYFQKKCTSLPKSHPLNQKNLKLIDYPVTRQATGELYLNEVIQYMIQTKEEKLAAIKKLELYGYGEKGKNYLFASQKNTCWILNKKIFKSRKSVIKYINNKKIKKILYLEENNSFPKIIPEWVRNIPETEFWSLK